MNIGINGFKGWLSNPKPEHVVGFYSSDNELINNLAEYISAGMEEGNNCLIIATPDHIRQLNEAFAQGKTMPASLLNENCAVFNAEVVLAKFMIGGMPNKQRFQETVGRLIEEAEGQPIRAYGEMVALLWEAGKKDAAIALEKLWNELAESHSYSLYCAYPKHLFQAFEDETACISACHDFRAHPLAAS